VNSLLKAGLPEKIYRARMMRGRPWGGLRGGKGNCHSLSREVSHCRKEGGLVYGAVEELGGRVRKVGEEGGRHIKESRGKASQRQRIRLSPEKGKKGISRIARGVTKKNT